METWCEHGRGGYWIPEVLQGGGQLQTSRAGWLIAADATSVITSPFSQGDLPRALLSWTSLL